MEDEKKEFEAEQENDDSREEDIVEDTDADTEDVVEEEKAVENNSVEQFDEMMQKLDKILGGIDSLRDAQALMVENGAVVRENVGSELDTGSVDEYADFGELDFTI